MRNRWLVGTRTAYLGIAWLYVVAIMFQVLLIGLNLFAGEATRETHIGFGHMIGIFPLLTLIVAFAGRLPRWAKVMAGSQFGLFILQAEVFAAIRAQFPVVASFHPVLAMVVFAFAVVVAHRSAGLVRTPAEELAAMTQARA